MLAAFGRANTSRISVRKQLVRDRCLSYPCAVEKIFGFDTRALDRARASRDARFDGKFFIAVTSTRIYCRPVCKVRDAKRSNIRYYPTAAAAAEAGFRPCLRCRPEAAPGTPAWLGTLGVVRRGLRLIEEGMLDDRSVVEMAARLGIGARHLHRLFVQHLGASPIAVARIEVADKDRYARTVATPGHGWAIIQVRNIHAEHVLEFRVSCADATSLLHLSSVARRVFDLASDPATIGLAFEDDPILAPLVKRRPGIRIPGVWDPLECSVRAIVGQQVSFSAGVTLLGRVVERAGQAISTPINGLTHLFPSPVALMSANLTGLGLTGGRIDAIKELASAIVEGKLDFSATAE